MSLHISEKTREVVGSMEERHRKILDDYRITIIQDLDVQDIMDTLIQLQIISDSMKDRIMANPTRQGRASSFLDILKRRGAKAFPAFLKAMKKEYKFLYNQLKEADTSSMKEQKTAGLEVTKMYGIGKDLLRSLRSDRFKISVAHTDDELELYECAGGNVEVDEDDQEEGYILAIDLQGVFKGKTQGRKIVVESHLTAVLKSDVIAKRVDVGPQRLDINADEPQIYRQDDGSSGWPSSEIDDIDENEKHISNQNKEELCPDMHIEQATSYMDNVVLSDTSKLSGCFPPVEEPRYFVPTKQETVKINRVNSIIRWLWLIIVGAISYIFPWRTNCGDTNTKGTSMSYEEMSPTTRDIDMHVPLRNAENSLPQVPYIRRQSSVSCNSFISASSHLEHWVLLQAGELLIVQKKPKPNMKGYVYVYNKKGAKLLIKLTDLRLFGDPVGEQWFYPVEISSRQATLFLRDSCTGSFLVYATPVKLDNVLYNLSLRRQDGQVSHYYIYCNENKEIGLKDKVHFLTIQDFVEYHTKNRGTLACRLRQALGHDKQFPIKAGIHYSAEWDIPRENIELEEGQLGQGHFGSVQAGIYDGQQVAVKFLIGRKSGREDEDFLEEATIHFAVDHANIVRALGMVSGRVLALVTEYISGGDLLSYVKSKSIPLDEMLKLFQQVLAALSYLKSQQFVIHRDMAARNCLVCSDGTVKISDFGLARKVMDDNYHAEDNEKFAIRWSSPEVLLHLQFSTKSDIWAAGVLLWELLTAGEVPYKGLSNSDTARYVVQGKRLDCPECCPEAVFNIMEQFWRTEPEQRPNAEEAMELVTRHAYNLVAESDDTLMKTDNSQNSKESKTASKTHRRVHKFFKSVRSATLKTTEKVPSENNLE